jgi:hypothetical protein
MCLLKWSRVVHSLDSYLAGGKSLSRICSPKLTIDCLLSDPNNIESLWKLDYLYPSIYYKDALRGYLNELYFQTDVGSSFNTFLGI